MEKSPPPIKLKYDESTVEDGGYIHPLALDNYNSAERKIDTQKSSSDEEVSFAWPLDMEFNSEIKFTEKNILAMEEYLQKAEVFHHLYQPLDQVNYMRKAIMLYRDVKQREEEHKK